MIKSVTYKYLAGDIRAAEEIAIEFLHDGHSVELCPENGKYALRVRRVRETAGGENQYQRLRFYESSGECIFCGNGSGGHGIFVHRYHGEA